MKQNDPELVIVAHALEKITEARRDLYCLLKGPDFNITEKEWLEKIIARLSVLRLKRPDNQKVKKEWEAVVEEYNTRFSQHNR